MKRLLIRPGAIGDFIVSLPALEFLRAEYTELWCPKAVARLARFADRTVSIAGSGIERISPEVKKRLAGFDEIHSWYGTNQPEFREAMRGLPFRFYPALPSGNLQHATDFYLAQVGGPLGGVPRVGVPRLPGGYAGLHPFSGSAAKNWPLDRWRELARLLEPRMPVHWCRGPEDDLPGAVMIPDLLELAQWLANSRVFIGNDSGITHLAAAAGAPVVVLFRKSDPAVWAPRGRDVTVLEEPPAAAVAEAVP